jgi:single-strand DNA-binding protein
MPNEASISVSGYVATQPTRHETKAGDHMLSMRIGWTPRLFDRASAEWKDQPTSFASVICFRKVAENGAICLRKGDPIVVKGTLRIREYDDQSGARRIAVDIIADSIGHNLAHGVSSFTKSRPRTGQTAMEHEEAERAAGRMPPAGELAEREIAEDAEPLDAEPLDAEELDAITETAEPALAQA